MKTIGQKQALFIYVLIVALFTMTLSPIPLHAAPDVARFTGDLKVEGITFSDNSVQRKASPWNLDTGNMYIISGNVGIGTPTPDEQLQLTGNIKLPATTATAGIIKSEVNTLLHTYGIHNLFVGVNAGNLTSTGSGNNTAAGFAALTANTSGDSNSAFGSQALSTNTTGNRNTAIGNAALSAVTTSSDNTAVGYFSLSKATSIGNTGIGSSSLVANTTGGSNSAVGNQSMIANTTGDYNTGTGAWALRHLFSGNYNSGLGVNAGYNLTTGSFNTFLGWMARPDATTPGLQYSTAIGANAIVAQNNSMVLGGTGTYAVSVGIGTPAPADRLQVVGDIRLGTLGTNGCVKNFAGTGILGTCSSDERLKTDIRPFGPVLSQVAMLEPVHFSWRAEEFPEYRFGAGQNAGLIAQQVEQVFPDMVTLDEKGYKTVNYSELPYLMLAAIRELKSMNDRQSDDLRIKDEQIRRLEERVNRLERLR